MSDFARGIRYLDRPYPWRLSGGALHSARAGWPGRAVHPASSRRRVWMGRAGPGSFGAVAAQRRCRAMRAGRGRSGGELHRPVPDGRRNSPPAGGSRPRGSDSGHRRPGLRLPGYRPGSARPPGAPGPGAEPGLSRRQRVHERDRRGSRLAEPSYLGHAAGRLCPGERHLDRRRPGPPPAASRRHAHTAGRPWRPGSVAAAPGAGPRLHPGRVPRLGAGRVPGRPRPPRPGTWAGAGAAPAEGDQDGPVPGPGRRTARVFRLPPARRRRRDQRRPRPPGRPAPRHRPRRPAQSRPGREERSYPMIVKLAIALAVVLIVAASAVWAFLPARHLPGNRARHLRIRLHLRLHPGKGFAHAFSLWLRWSRFAVLRRSGRIRPALPLVTGSWTRASTRCSSAGLTTGTGCACRLLENEEHLLVMAPPRTFKTALLADVILRYPGPVIATSTKPDVYALSSAVRAQLGPVHVFNPQHIGGVPSTFCWSPVDGCQD